MPPKGRPAPQMKPSNINLNCENEPTTILCKEIEEMLGTAAPTTMELSWLQNLNLLLSRTVSAVSQANDWTTKISKEVKYTLLCLADRRKSLRSTTCGYQRAPHQGDALL
ncbi:hypothetical protein RAB80_006603 [Fusarium oxysporum f. sp. vasinfectum]|nr:hypothetical protein RAB80_006603 [Fusarium oxysporum f. sp. vasinfectum]